MNDTQRPDDRPDPPAGRTPTGQFPPPGPTAGRFAPPPGPPVPPYPPAPRRTSPWKVIGIVAAVLFGIPVVLLVIGMIAVAARGDGPSSSPPPAAASPFASDTVLDVRPGECFDSAPLPADGSSTSVTGVEKIPCTEPHTQQAVDVTAFTQPWAGVQSEAEQRCSKAFTNKVPRKVLSDGVHRPAMMHSDTPSTSYVVCVIATDQPATGSVLK